MNELFKKLQNAIEHLKALHSIFKTGSNYAASECKDFKLYKENLENLTKALGQLHIHELIYSAKHRQMILADLYEYIFLGRSYYSAETKEQKEIFIKTLLYFVNLLMTYETITVSDNLRSKVLEMLEMKVESIKNEPLFNSLKSFKGKIGLPGEDSDAEKELNKYFDTILPKTAGGLWHELLVYIFMLRNDVGFIIPLLLSQRLLSTYNHVVPPDFLIITNDKRMYGVEVGGKKEIQSGMFSLQTYIPTATIDTENSRTSDRCPICKRWIQFCSFVIDQYSNLTLHLEKPEIKCLGQCKKYRKEQIVAGECAYTKYSRKAAKTLGFTQHEYSTGLHYHYKCVLDKLSADKREHLIRSEDKTAIKTHYPFYSGIECLLKKG